MKIILLLPLIFIGVATISGWWIVGKKKAIYPVKLFAIVWTVTFLVELAGHITRQMAITNQSLYNGFNFFLYIGLAFSFKHQLKNPAISRLIEIYSICFVVFGIINTAFIQGWKNLQTLSIVLGGGFIFFLACAYFWQLYKSEETEKITHDPYFWFSFGLMAYLGGTIPFLGMLNYLWDNFKEFTQFYFLYVSNGFIIFLNILVTIGFLCRRNYPRLR
jgi:hypothetical protein